MGNMSYCFKRILISNNSLRQQWRHHYKIVMFCAIPIFVLVCILSVCAGSIRVEGTEERVTEAAIYEPVRICRGTPCGQLQGRTWSILQMKEYRNI